MSFLWKQTLLALFLISIENFLLFFKRKQEKIWEKKIVDSEFVKTVTKVLIDIHLCIFIQANFQLEAEKLTFRTKSKDKVWTWLFLHRPRRCAIPARPWIEDHWAVGGRLCLFSVWKDTKAASQPQQWIIVHFFACI